MNTKHLALFEQVVKTGNITQVAKDLHVSQPAISMQLKRLKQEIGVSLFTIVGRNISVTDAGLTFLEYAKLILSLEGQIYRTMEEFRLGNRGRIVVGALLQSQEPFCFLSYYYLLQKRIRILQWK